MWFSLIVVILIVAITLFQSTQGAFSALLMTVLTIGCAALALGNFEWAATNFLAPYWQPDFAPAIALAVLFGVPLVVLRVVTDKLITRSPLLPALVDRVGAGICGVVTALVTVGVFAIAVQMVPFHNGSILGYARVDVQPRTKPEGGANPTPPAQDEPERELWLQPDRFAVALTSLLSSGLFSGSRSFLEDHPDFVAETGWIGAAPAAATRYAPPGSIQVIETRTVPMVYKVIPAQPRTESPIRYEPINPEPGHEFRMIRVQLTRKARGSSKSHIFTLRQFRLVGSLRTDDRFVQYYPIAIQQNENTAPNRHIRLEQNGQWGAWPVTEVAYEPRDGNGGQVEVVFELPKEFDPAFVEYKRSARAAVTFKTDDQSNDESASRTTETEAGRGGRLASNRSSDEQQDGSSSGAPADANANSDDGSGRRRRRGGNVRTATTRTDESSHFGSALPLTLTSYRTLKNAELGRGTLKMGHLVAMVEEQDGGRNREVKEFAVPEGKRLLHLNTEKLHARSGIGRVISGAVETAQNFTVEDDRGNVYSIVGKYARAVVDGKPVFEVQYFQEPAGSIGGLGKFDKINNDDLTGDYQLVYLFLVDPGARLVSFDTGGSASRKDDLRGQDLVAPD